MTIGHFLWRDNLKKIPTHLDPVFRWYEGVINRFVNHLNTPTLPDSCAALPQAFKVNLFQWRF